MKELPRIIKENGLTWLQIDGKPMYILGAQVMNYNATNLAYLDQEIWPKLRPLHPNTVLFPVYWHSVEPQEGVFDFTLFDGLLAQCRREGVRLIPLWFGLWKSTFGTYTPSWLKRSCEIYHRVQKADGTPVNTMSPLCEANVEADARAFAALMRHIKAVDAEEQTVIMVQCENECGMFRTDRDYGEQATALFNAAVPAKVAAVYGSGTWPDVFGADAPEAFSSWSFAQAVQQIAAAGKAEYDLPICLNAWLENPAYGPGQSYPNGGCINKFLPIWQATAPALFALTPNAYGDFAAVCDSYASHGNPLLVPETFGGLDTPANLLYAFGRHNAIGFSPFGAEMIYDSKRPNPAAPAITAAYDLIANMRETLHKAHLEGRIHAFIEDGKRVNFFETKKYRINILFGNSKSFILDGGFGFGASGEKKPMGGGFVIQEDEDTFLFVGTGFTPEFLPKAGTTGQTDMDWADDGHYENDVWVPGRIYTGDTYGNCMRLGNMPSMVRCNMYIYK